MSHFIPPTIEELQALIPNYQIESILAQGERSAVYVATHTTLGRRVAIKILPQHLSENEAFKTAFEKSAKALASVQHPNIAGVYDFGNVNGMLYTVLEHVSGRSLFDIAYGQKLEGLQVAGVISAMAKGLHNAHLSGILHLDVKPTNVLIDDAGNAKLVDFKGTLPTADEVTSYTAPESVNRPDLVDQKADIYAIGVILYELLTSQLPAEHIVPASSLVPCDPGFDQIIAKALHPNPEMRYLTAEEMGNEIDQLVLRLQQATAPQSPFNTGPVKLATGPAATAPQLGAARPMLTAPVAATAPARPALTAPIALNAPAATGGLNTGAQTGALSGITGSVPVSAPAHNPLAGVAGRPATAGAAPMGAGGLGARPMVKTSSGGGATIWVVLALVAVVGGVLAMALSGGGDDKVADGKSKKKKSAAAQKAKDRDQREADRLARIKRERAQAAIDAKADEEEDKEIAKEEKMEAKEAALKKKFIGAWQYKEDGATWRRTLHPDGKLALFKNGKNTQKWAGYTWDIDGDFVKMYKSDGSYLGKVEILASGQADFDGLKASRRAIGAAWDKSDKEPNMADKDKDKDKGKDKTAKKDEPKTGSEGDVIAQIMAEEDVPEIKMTNGNKKEAQFDVKTFIKEERKKISKKIDEALLSKTQRIGPVTRKLNREIVPAIADWNKGDEGKAAVKLLRDWFRDCESKSTILPLPSGLSAGAKDVTKKIMKANQFILDDLNSRPLYDIQDLKDEYSQAMRRKAHELRPKNDHGAMFELQMEDTNTTRSNKAFITTVWENLPK